MTTLSPTPQPEVETASGRFKIPEWYSKTSAPAYVPGWSYLYGIENSGCLKIGLSRDIQQRCADIQTYNPRPCLIVMRRRIHLSGALYAERYLHEIFADRRMHGEWFDVRVEEVRPFLPEAVKRAKVAAEIRRRINERYPCGQTKKHRPLKIDDVVNMPILHYSEYVA